MSLYAEYVKERAGIDMLESDNGFMSYQVQGKECFIHDAYVKPQHRKNGEGARMLGEIVGIAREHGCSYLAATVCPQANGATDSLKAMLAVGFNLWASSPTLISLKKEI